MYWFSIKKEKVNIKLFNLNIYRECPMRCDLTKEKIVPLKISSKALSRLYNKMKIRC